MLFTFIFISIVFIAFDSFLDLNNDGLNIL